MMYIYPRDAAAGSLAAAAMRISKRDVAELQRQVRSGETDRARSGLAAVCPGVRELSAEQLRDAVEELVCFRVYMRVYLGKHRLAGVPPEQAAAGFCERLPALEAALRKPGQERMTVLPESIDVRMSIDGAGKISYSFTSFCQLLLFDMLSARQSGGGVLMCPLCSGVFVSTRSDVVYCPDCRPGGARTAHMNALRSDPLRAAYSRMRQRVYTAKSRGTIDDAAAKRILRRMRESMLRAQSAGSSPEQLMEELSKITD